jgi:hypothetical protein
VSGLLNLNDKQKEFLMLKYARELESPPDFLPFGWAAILELYGQR